LKKRVLFVLNACGGGATQGIKEYLKFQQNDIEAYLALPTPPNEQQKEWMDRYAKKWVVVNMPWWNLPNNMPFFYTYLLFFRNLIQGRFRSVGTAQLAKFIKQEKIDFVYTGSILIKEGALAAKRLGIPHFWHIKETFGSSGRVKFLINDSALQKFLLNHSKAIICMTEYIKSFFTEQVSNPKLKVISDGIEPVDFKTNLNKRAELRLKFGIADDEVLIGMVASLSSTWKNHTIFIQAATLLKSSHKVKFIAFGPEPQKFANKVYNTPHNYYQGLRQRVQKSGLGEKFIWAGFHPDVPAIFEALDIFVHPCETEPFGRVIIEAMAAGKAVVVPDQGGASEPVIQEQNGLKFKSNNTVDMADKIQILVDRSSLRTQIGQMAKTQVSESNYTLQCYAESMHILFNSL
jgi:glycosyltransferase involved in cell wall biosynthesis